MLLDLLCGGDRGGGGGGSDGDVVVVAAKVVMAVVVVAMVVVIVVVAMVAVVVVVVVVRRRWWQWQCVVWCVETGRGGTVDWSGLDVHILGGWDEQLEILVAPSANHFHCGCAVLQHRDGIAAGCSHSE